MKKYILLVLLASAFFACNRDDIEAYESGRFLYIPDSLEMNSAFVSFKHHLGKDSYKVPFIVRMIGSVSTENLPYEIEVIDSLTTAAPEDYSWTAPVFGAGRNRDTLWLEIHNTAHLNTETVRLEVRLVENENFRIGYYDRLTAGVSFNNQMSQPLWWDENITNLFLGTYSEEKYLAFYACTGVSDLTDLPFWRLRQLTLEFRAYIEKHGLTEKNGEPMTVVAY